MRRQIVLIAAGVTALVVLAFLIPLALVVRSTASHRAIGEARSNAEALVSAVAVESAASLEKHIKNASTAGHRVSVISADGAVVGDASDSVRPETLGLARQGRAFAQKYGDGVEILIPVVTASGGTSVVRVVVPAGLLHHGVYATWAAFGALGFGLVLASALLADRTARSITGPLDEVTTVALSLARGELSARSDERGTSEVRSVGRSLNVLAQKIEGLVQHERESLADLSHSLRTPLTALRLESEHLRDPSERHELLQAVDRLEGAVSDLITQVRQPTPVTQHDDLADALRDRMAYWAVLAKAQRRAVDVDIAATVLPVGLSRRIVYGH